MTVPAVPNYATFAGNGTTGPFTFNFPFQLSTDLVAAVTDQYGSITPALVASITGAGSDTGGSISLTAALPVGSSLTVFRIMPLAQQTQLPNGGPYFAATIEAALDYLTMLCQQLQESIDRLSNTVTYVNADPATGAGKRCTPQLVVTGQADDGSDIWAWQLTTLIGP